jgi:hypothetical protein
MIRTSCQQVVDEFIDVKINGKLFHLCILEDSYGPMRIMISQNKITDGRDVDEESDEEEEEVERSLFMEEEEEEQEREMEGENVNYVAFTPEVNSNNGNNNIVVTVSERINSKNGVSASHCLDSNSNNIIINSGGWASSKGGVVKVNSKTVEGGFCLGQEVGVVGPQNSTNTSLSITGGVNCNGSPHQKCINSQIEGEGRIHKGGIYSEGPRAVFNKLNKLINDGPIIKTLSCPLLNTKDNSGTSLKRIHPIPASVRRQNQLIHKLNLRKPNSSIPLPVVQSSSRVSDVNPRPLELEFSGAVRNSPSSRPRGRTKSADSLSSAGEILCCSSIGSSEIRNCNTRFIVNHDNSTANKVWQGAAKLGVEGDEEEAQYVSRILINEKKEESARKLREQQKQGNL